MRGYLELAKPRITVMVATTAALGFWCAGGRSWSLLAWTVLGTALASASAAALNQCLEREQDALMRRTQGRPLPTGRLSSAQGWAFGLGVGSLGVALLAWKAGGLAAGIAFATVLLYAFAYTPLKRLTPQSTWIGAVAGATPPLIGWAAAAGRLDAGAWCLFGIQFVWQIPHFLALFWLYREEYARAGFKVMPVLDVGATAVQIAIHSLALLLASLLPAFIGMTGPAYAPAALIVGAAFLVLGLKASWTMATADARRLFRASLVYLPVVFGMLAGGIR